jgi:hypothetical protein
MSCACPVSQQIQCTARNRQIRLTMARLKIVIMLILVSFRISGPDTDNNYLSNHQIIHLCFLQSQSASPIHDAPSFLSLFAHFSSL